MVNEKYIILMNQEIDGENTPQDSADLKAFLHGNAEAEQVFGSLKHVSASMDGMEQVEPPSYLKNRILNQIDTKRYLPKETFSLGTLLESVKGLRLTWRFAVSFAGGAVAGIVLLILLNSVTDQDLKFQDWDMYRGTIVPEVLLDPTYVIDSILVDEASVAGEISLRYIDPYLVLHMDLETQDPIQIEFNLDDALIEFQGMRISEIEAPPNLVVHAGRFRFNQIGNQSVYLFFNYDKSIQSDVQFMVSKEGSMQFSKVLHVALPPKGQ